MPSFRNVKTGVVKTFPDTPETGTELPGRDTQWQNFLSTYRRSKRWETISDAEAEAAREDEYREPEPIPPAYLDPGDGSAPYPIPPANAVALDDRGRPTSQERPVHPGYQAGPIHDPNPHAEGREDQLRPHSQTHAAFEGQTVIRTGEQPDVDGNRPDGTSVVDKERQAREAPIAARAGRLPGEGGTAESAQGGGGLPDQNARKAEWVSAAQGVGLSKAEADEMNKPDLIAEVRRRSRG
jgi:hypothetical protein